MVEQMGPICQKWGPILVFQIPIEHADKRYIRLESKGLLLYMGAPTVAFDKSIP